MKSTITSVINPKRKFVHPCFVSIGNERNRTIYLTCPNKREKDLHLYQNDDQLEADAVVVYSSQKPDEVGKYIDCLNLEMCEVWNGSITLTS